MKVRWYCSCGKKFDEPTDAFDHRLTGHYIKPLTQEEAQRYGYEFRPETTGIERWHNGATI